VRWGTTDTELEGPCPFLRAPSVGTAIELEVRVADRVCVGVVVVGGGGWASVAMAAKYWMTFFVLSVFPAPDSPLNESQFRMRVVEIHVRDQDALILLLIAHVHPRPLRDFEDVRLILFSSLASIFLNNGVRVQWEILVGIDGHQEEA